MSLACQDLLAPGFLHSGPESLDALGKKRHTQQMEKNLLVHAAGSRGSRRASDTTVSLAGWHLNRFRIGFWFQFRFAGGAGPVYRCSWGWHLWAL